MRKRFDRCTRFVCVLLSLIVLLCPICQTALAEEYQYVAPSLPADAEPYDPEKPENYACYAFGPAVKPIGW